jgi:HD-like signal output (HDOD) protein
MTKAPAKSTSILALVNRTLELPTIPEVLVRLNDVVSSDESTADDVADVIAKDPAVSANILRIVNSAYYGLQVRVSSVSLAVSILGFSATKRVALKAAVFSRFAREGGNASAHFDPRNFWTHSVYTGVAARVIGHECAAFDAYHGEDLYICGLLHDIGKIILLENLPAEYQRVLAEAARSGRPECVVEREVFGFSHADVGSVLAIKWFLPEDLTIAIRYHHDPSQDPFHRSLSALVHLADHLAWKAGRPSTAGTSAPALRSDVFERVGVETALVADLTTRIESEFAASGLPF